MVPIAPWAGNASSMVSVPTKYEWSMVNGTYVSSEYPNRQIARYDRQTKAWENFAGAAVNSPWTER